MTKSMRILIASLLLLSGSGLVLEEENLHSQEGVVSKPLKKAKHLKKKAEAHQEEELEPVEIEMVDEDGEEREEEQTMKKKKGKSRPKVCKCTCHGSWPRGLIHQKKLDLLVGSGVEGGKRKSARKITCRAFEGGGSAQSCAPLHM